MAAEHNTGIYEIRNLVNGKRYVGGSRNFANRWRQHRQSLERGDHHSRALQAEWQEHGAESFRFLPVLICGEENLLTYEQIVMDFFLPEYNRSPTAGSQRGLKFTAESRARSAAAARRTRNFTGKHHSEESKAKISAAKSGVKVGPYDSERIAKTAAAMRESKNAMSEDEVRTIRKMHADGRPHKEAAFLLGRTYWAVADVVRGRTFKWVE